MSIRKQKVMINSNCNNNDSNNSYKNKVHKIKIINCHLKSVKKKVINYFKKLNFTERPKNP